MIICNKIFTAQCGRCEKFYCAPDSENTEGFASPDDAVEEIKSEGWVMEQNECFCPKCIAAIREQRRKEEEQPR